MRSEATAVPAVWVLGMFETGLAASRSLGRAGIRVHGIDFNPDMAGSRSRYVHFRQMPSPVSQPDELADALLRAVREEPKPAVLFPATDGYVSFVSRYRDVLAPHFRFALPSSDVVEALLDKAGHVRLAESVGETCPATYTLGNLAEAREVTSRLVYPAFVKGRHPHLWRTYFEHKGFRVENAGELLTAFQDAQAHGLESLVQEVIPGPATQHFEVSFYCSAHGEGEILALLGVRKIRQYPPEFGGGSCVETLHNPEVTERALRFAKAIDFRGIGNIEYKLDERNGKYYLIELNARLWQQNAMAEACGINFPLIAYRDLLGLPVAPQTEFPEGVKWLDPVADVAAFWVASRQGSLGLRSWLASLRGVRSYSGFSRDDPLPGLHDVQFGLKFVRLAASYLLRNSQGTKNRAA